MELGNKSLKKDSNFLSMLTWSFDVSVKIFLPYPRFPKFSNGISRLEAHFDFKINSTALLSILASCKFLCGTPLWFYAGINLTGYHPPGPLIFSVKIPAPGTAFQCKTPAPGSKKRNKIHNLPGSNVKIFMKKEHNSIRAVSFQIFHNCRLDNFLLSCNKVFYTTVKINTTIMQ